MAVFKFKTDREAKQMLSALETLTLQRFKDMERNASLRVRDKKSVPYTAGPVSSGTSWQYSVEALFLGKRIFSHVLLRQNNTVIQFMESDSGLSQDLAASLIAESIQIINSK